MNAPNTIQTITSRHVTSRHATFDQLYGMSRHVTNVTPAWRVKYTIFDVESPNIFEERGPRVKLQKKYTVLQSILVYPPENCDLILLFFEQPLYTVHFCIAGFSIVLMLYYWYSLILSHI